MHLLCLQRHLSGKVLNKANLTYTVSVYVHKYMYQAEKQSTQFGNQWCKVPNREFPSKDCTNIKSQIYVIWVNFQSCNMLHICCLIYN